ncbi:hypothetical protein ACTS9C_10845 [Empedobacter brevis]
MKKLFLTLLMSSSLVNVLGQQTEGNNSVKNYDFSNFPKSPDAAAFSKYIDIPASTHTGVVNISVPIYSFSFDGQNFPISLEYNTSGIKLDEIASNVGLGWTLSIGGISLSKQVMGVFDHPAYQKWDVSQSFTPGGSPTYNTSNQTYSDTYKALDALGYWQGNHPNDMQPDIYNFSVLNHSGQFILDYKDRNRGIPIPYKDFKIVRISKTWGYDVEIIDDQGVKYTFYNSKYSTSANNCSLYDSALNGMTDDEYLIKEIQTPNNKKIMFTYLDGNVIGSYGTSVINRYLLSSEISGFGLRPPILIPNCYNYTLSLAAKKYLSKISFEEGEIQFIYGEDTRKDIKDDKYINQFLIKDKNGNLVKKITLDLGKNDNGYFVSEGLYTINDQRFMVGNNYRLKLNAVIDEISGQKYLFQYYPGNLPPRLSHSKDYWGVYNGKNNSTSIGPAEYLDYHDYVRRKYNSPNDLKPYIDYGKIGNLQKITFPTNGTQELFYENDDFIIPDYYNPLYNSLGIISDGRGKTGTLRVSKIVLDNSKGEKIIKKYNYINPKTNKTSGINYGTFNLNSVKKGIVYNESGNTLSYNYLTNNPGWQLSTIGGKAVGYSHVQETVENYKEPSKNYKTTYEYFFDPESYESDWTNYDPESQVNFSYPIYNPEKGLLRKKETYNNTNELIKKDSLIYNIDNYFNTKSSIYNNKYMLYSGQDLAINSISCVPGTGACSYTFDWVSFDIKTSWIQNKKTISTEYFPNGNVVTTTENNYSPSYKHLYPTNTTSTTSKGETITTEYQYPPDLVGQEDYMTELKQANRISEPVVVKQKVDGTYISEVHNQYNLFSGIVQKSAVHQKRGDGINIKTSIADRKITYDSYDTKGNLTQYTLENGIPVSIIWGYNGQYPILKVEGVALQDIPQWLIDYIKYPSDVGDNQSLFVRLNYQRNEPYFKDALVTGYIYKPLVGVTQIIQPNGMTEKYNYDTANRLKSIVNDQNEVIKTFEYNYKQP